MTDTDFHHYSHSRSKKSKSIHNVLSNTCLMICELNWFVCVGGKGAGIQKETVSRFLTPKGGVCRGTGSFLGVVDGSRVQSPNDIFESKEENTWVKKIGHCLLPMIPITAFAKTSLSLEQFWCMFRISITSHKLVSKHKNSARNHTQPNSAIWQNWKKTFLFWNFYDV